MLARDQARHIQYPSRYLYSLTRHFFLAESVLVADPEQGVSRA